MNTVLERKKNWYLLKVQFNYERMVADNLNKIGKNSDVYVRCLVPMERTFVTRKGVRELKETVYMNGYVYVETYADEIAKVANLAFHIKGSQGFMKGIKGSEPRPLSRVDLVDLKNLVGEEVFGSDSTEDVYTGKNTMIVSSIFKPNDAVRIKSGAYENLIAEVKSVDNNLVTVTIKIFGRDVPVVLDKNELEHTK